MDLVNKEDRNKLQEKMDVSERLKKVWEEKPKILRRESVDVREKRRYLQITGFEGEYAI